MAHKAWFKAVNPESSWAKVSIQHVYDIKTAIKAETSCRLNPYNAEHLILKATKNDKDPSHAMELGEEASLVFVLEHFGIAGSPSVEQAFANNIRLFVFAPSRPGTYFVPNYPYPHSFRFHTAVNSRYKNPRYKKPRDISNYSPVPRNSYGKIGNSGYRQILP